MVLHRVVQWVLLGLGFLAFEGCAKPMFTLRLSQETLQSQLEKNFPLSMEEPASAQLKDPVLILTADSDRIGLRVSIEGELPGKPLPGLPGPKPNKRFEGTIEVSGFIRYDAKQGGIHLDSPAVDAFSVGQMPEALAKAMGNGVEKLLMVYLKQNPVHQLSNDQRLQAAGKTILKDVRVNDRHLLVSLGL